MPGRPSTSFPLKQRRLTPDLWPASDREAWERALHPGSLLEDPGKGADWQPHTRRIRSGYWGSYLAYLTSTDQLLETETVEHRLTHSRLGGYIKSLNARLSPHTVYQGVRELSYVAEAMTPDRDWSWVRRHPSGPSHAAARAARKQPEVFNPGAVANAAFAAMDAVDRDLPTIPQATRFRDAMMVAFLCYVPLRRSNFASLTLGHQLRFEHGIVRVVVEAEETKNDSPIDRRLPDSLLPYLTRYLVVHRQRLLLGGTTRTLGESWTPATLNAISGPLWINDNGEHLKWSAIWAVMDRIGQELAGRHITAHLFRHSSATAIMNHDPSKLRLASDTLAHRTERVTSEHYDQSTADAAQNVYADIIEQKRQIRDQEDDG